LASYAAALASPATLAAPPKGSLDASEVLIQEVEAADVIVIGTPMYNYTARALVDAMERQKDWEPAVRPLQAHARHDVTAAELAVDCQVEKR
jgi:NAD(P)H-dependent FMN reductase